MCSMISTSSPVVTPELIAVKNITKRYGERLALKGINLTIYEGEILGLLGPNGAGKTTLSSLIASLHPPTSGDILYKNSSIYNNIIDYRTHIGFCPQKPTLAANLTVYEQLLFGGRYFLLEEHQLKARINELLEQFNLTEYKNSNPAELSGGYKQRLLLARALIHHPEIVILDEPTIALDPHVRHHLWESIKQLKREGVTIILTTHYLDEAEILSDRICVLDKGTIRLIDTPAGLMNTYNKAKLEDVFLHLMEETTAENSKNK